MIANLGLGGTTFGSGCLLDDLIHFVYQGRNDRLSDCGAIKNEEDMSE